MVLYLGYDTAQKLTADKANSLFDSHKKYLEWRKTEWATRGTEALKTRQLARASTHTSWRQMKGMQLALHEMNHPGNKPFVIGAGVMSVLYLTLFMRQSNEMRAESEYWSKYHMKK